MNKIRRFPRTKRSFDSDDISKLLRSAGRSLRAGNITKLRRRLAQAISATHQRDMDIRSWDDLPVASAAGDEKIEWLVEGLIPAKQVTVIVAAKDSYKSTLMLALAKAATTGGEFLGAKCCQKLVLYLNRDMPKAVFDEYCRMIKIDKDNSNFKILSSLWNTSIQPMEPDDPTLLWIARNEQPVIIFDYLAKFCDGKLDNEREIDELMGKLKLLAAYGTTVILLHHVPKNDKDSEGFGSVYIINGADFAWKITREGGQYASASSTKLKIQNTKNKMGDYFSLKVRPQLKNDPPFLVVSKKSEATEKLEADVERFKAIFPEDWIEKRELQRLASKEGFSRSKFNDLYDLFVDREYVRTESGASNLQRCKLRKEHRQQ